jgi:hypothetical protein
MACTNTADLIALTHKAYAKLARLIAPLDQGRSARGQGDVTIKDVIGHRAHWIDLSFGWNHDGKAGKKVSFPSEAISGAS